MTANRVTLSSAGMNALGTDMMEQLLKDLEKADGGAILLTGEGSAFSAGLNLKEVMDLDDAGMVQFLDLLERLVHTFYSYPGPMIGCINGHAIAGGAVLALMCDYRVMTSDESARFGLNEVALGLRFPPLTLAAVRQRVPVSVQHEVLLGGRLYCASDALRLGLVDELSEDPMATAERVMNRWGSYPPSSFTPTKRAIRPTIGDALDERDRYLNEVIPLWTSERLKERLRGVLGK